MFSLWRCNRFGQLPRWGLQFLLGGVVALAALAAEPEVEPAGGPEQMEAVPDLHELTIEELEQLGQRARASATATLELISSPTAPLELRRRAALALASIGLENQEQAQMLFAVVADPAADLDLRRTILMAFGENELFAPSLVPVLLKIVTERGDDPMLRREALFALRQYAGHEAVVPTLGRVLANSSEDAGLRLALLDHLRMFVSDPKPLAEVLATIARNKEEAGELRTRAMDALRGMGRDALSASAALVGVLSDRQEEAGLRLSAVAALRQTGWTEADSPVLAALMFDPDTPDALRGALADLVGRMEPLPSLLASQWLPVLKDTNAPLATRRLAARMLARADLGLPDGLDLSRQLLDDPSEDLQIRLGAGEFLRRSGVEAAPARETLERLLLNVDAPAELREVASTALAQVAQVWLERPDRLDRITLNRRLASVDHAVAVMERAGLRTPPHPQNLEAVRRVREVLLAEKNSRWSAGLGDWAEAHPVLARWTGALAFLALGSALLTIVWWGMSRFAPLRLGKLDASLARYEVAFPRGMGGRSLGLRQVSLLAFWAGHERVLEAWTGQLRAQMQSAIEARQQRTDEGHFIDLPVTVDGVVHDVCPFQLMLQRLAEPGRSVLIAGEAGTGKTMLARQIVFRVSGAREDGRESLVPFLPVWIDAPIGDGMGGLFEAIRGQVQGRSRDGAPSIGLLRALLARGRIVPVLDGISEWAAADRECVLEMLNRPDMPSFLITARDIGNLGECRPLVVETPPLAGTEVARFVAGLLERTDGGRASNGIDVLEACGYWADLTAGRALPADGVRIFAEYLLMERGVPSGTGRPENLLELMRDYVRHRNRRVTDGRLPDDLVIKAAGEMAWHCARSEGAVDGSELPNSVPPGCVAYLEQKLGLVRIVPGAGRVRFLQTTLADQLAAGHLIDTHGKDDEAWRRLGIWASGGATTGRGSAPVSDELPGLSAAIWNGCYRLSNPFAPVPIPDWLHRAIEERLDAQVDPQLRATPRLRQLVRLVLAPENSERTAALEAMAALGSGAVPAISTLLSAFQKPGEDLEIRHAVLAVLTLLGRNAASAAPGLRHAIEDRKEHLFLRIKALDALVAAAPDDPATVQLLVDKSQDPAENELVRSRASQALAKLNRVEGNPRRAADPGSRVQAGL